MKVEAEFVRSAASTTDFPGDGLPEIALAGRSNVGKSTLINALVRQRLARTSSAPGKTRLANIYRVARRHATCLYLVDLPGYGYARGAESTARQFDELTQGYFARRLRTRGAKNRPGRTETAAADLGNPAAAPRTPAALLLIDARHPGLERDRAAWAWLEATADEIALVATKIDKLARGERIRAMRELQSVFDVPVLPISAVTGEGLDELWKLIDRLAKPSKPHSRTPPPRRTVRQPPTR